jgi:pyruvate,water dikinase
MPLAVLIQLMVPADAAGVVFTADPVSGDRDTVVVNAVGGLGDRLVGGEVSPDEWVVRGGEASRRLSPQDAVDEATVLRLAALARRAETALAGDGPIVPQDVEWAMRDGRLYLLQSRPVTALPEPPVRPVPLPVEVPPGFWERDAAHSPRPLSPMLASVFYAARNDGMREMFGAFGFLAETLEFREIGGWDYSRLVPVGGTDRPAPPAALMPLLARLVPGLRRRVRTAAASAREDRPGTMIEAWYDHDQPELTARFRSLLEVDRSGLPDEALAAHARAAAELLADGTRRHFLLHGAIGLTLAELAFTCRDLLGWDDSRTFELLNGLSVMSTRPAHRLAGLAAVAAPHRELLETVDDTTADRLRAADPALAGAFDAYLDEFGHRALRYEVADPAIAEVPAMVVRLLADQLARGYDPDAEIAALARHRAETAAAARDRLTGAALERFERALARAERAYPVREDNEAVTVSAPLAVVRYAIGEVGRRLAARDRLDQAGDVFFLTLDEALAALTGGAGDLHPLAARRKGERAWAEQHPGPAAYGTRPGPPPSLAGLPPAARFNTEALLWTVERIFAFRDDRPADEPVLAGVAASPGRYTGPVRVVMDELEFGKIRPGDVLVCPITSPVWSVLFASVGALVTDTGGLLSHPAIIAREYRLPAVVATGGATAVLRDGDLVTVDGTTGRVERH